VASNKSTASRQDGAMLGVPTGANLGTFQNYPEAQEMVNTLVREGVPARALSIVGSDVTLVERVTGKIGYGRAALSSAISGSWVGILAGLVVALIEPSDFLTPLAGGLMIGAGGGMVIGMLLFTFGAGKKQMYRSMQQVIAASYRVVVENAEHAHATQALSNATEAQRAARLKKAQAKGES